MRMLRQDLGKTRGGAEDQRDEANDVGVLPQQREKTPARAQAGEKSIKGYKSRIRIFRARELIDDDRHQLDQIGACLLTS
jgi:hypothetical protein